MIEIKSIYKSFEDKNVLEDISFTFENGKTNLIIGQSGSGKTVLMKCLVGLLAPNKGEVLYDGRNFLTMDKKEKKSLRREMGMIFQSAALFDSLTVLENVMFPLDMFLAVPQTHFLCSVGRVKIKSCTYTDLSTISVGCNGNPLRCRLILHHGY